MGTSSVDLRNTLTAHGKNERRFTFAEVVYWLDQYRDLSRRAVNYAELVDKKLNKLQSVYDSTVRLYEELRNSIDGGSESMTHEDAVKELRSMLKDSEELAKLREQKPVAYAPSLDVRNIPKYGRMTTLKAEDEYATYMALYAAPVPAVAAPKLQVWFGSLPETNGKTNWTAILHRDNFYEGITIARSEYKDRVRYEADRMRWMIGELSEEPDILQYAENLHSGYTEPAVAAPSVLEGGE